MSRLSPARAAALEACAQVRARDAFVREVLPGVLDARGLAGSDRALAVLLAVGVVQTQGALDAVLDGSMNSPHDVKPDVRDALRIAVYEMLYLGRDPYAAVSQGVELAARTAPRARGLANAVLRRAARRIEEMRAQGELPDALRFGFPEWLAADIASWLGEARARSFMEAAHGQPPVFASINAVRISDACALEALERAGIGFALEPTIPGCIRLADAADVASAAVKGMIARGELIVSDAAAQAVAWRVAERACATLLEVGAGRGTKTALIQSAHLRQHGCQIDRLVCVDNVAGKASLLAERAAACGAAVAQVVVADATDLAAALGDERFSTVFIDAPCTGLGTLRRHPEIRWRVQPESIAQAAALDARLLASAAAHVAADGALIYATCTIAPAENEEAVRAFLASPAGAGFVLDGSGNVDAATLASDGCDSHFCARMEKRG